VSVVAGARQRLDLPPLPALTVPDGMAPFVEVRVRPTRTPGTTAVHRMLTMRR
jgi:hypothetical protein